MNDEADECADAGKGPPQDSDHSGADLTHQLLLELIALREYASHFLAATIDETRARIRQAGVRLVMRWAWRMASAFLAVAFLIYLVRGIDGAFVAATGREWLGHLITGILGIGALVGIQWAGAFAREMTRRGREFLKYEERKAIQRERVGCDVDQETKAAA